MKTQGPTITWDRTVNHGQYCLNRRWPEIEAKLFQDSPSETSLQQRPVSRTLSERTQHFEEISLDSPDMGGNDGDVPEGNNNVIKMRTLGKAEEPPSEKKPPEEDSSDENPSPVPYYRLFRFASPTELGMAFVGILSAIVGGCSMPFMVIMYGELANAFVEQVSKDFQRETLLISHFQARTGGNSSLENCLGICCAEEHDIF